MGTDKKKKKNFLEVLKVPMSIAWRYVENNLQIQKISKRFGDYFSANGSGLGSTFKTELNSSFIPGNE